MSELLDTLQKLADSIDYQAKAIMALVATAADMMDTISEDEEPTEYLDGSCL